MRLRFRLITSSLASCTATCTSAMRSRSILTHSAGLIFGLRWVNCGLSVAATELGSAGLRPYNISYGEMEVPSMAPLLMQYTA